MASAGQDAELGVDSMTAWSQTSDGDISKGNTHARVDILSVLGDARLLLPYALLSGSMPYSDEDGVAIDEHTAYALFGSTDVAGLRTVLDGADVTVCGVFAMPSGAAQWGTSPGSGIAVRIAAAANRIGALGVRLSPSAEETAERAKVITGALGSPHYVDNLDETALWLRQLGYLPLWIWMIAALIPCGKGVWAYLRRPSPLDAYTAANRRRLKDILLRIAMAAGFVTTACAMLWLVGFAPGIPTAWLPTRWSDFSHWGKLAETLGQRAVLGASVSLSRAELAWQALPRNAMISCILFLLIRPPRTTRMTRGQWALSVAAPFAATGVCRLLSVELVFYVPMLIVPVLALGLRWLGGWLLKKYTVTKGKTDGDHRLQTCVKNIPKWR